VAADELPPVVVVAVVDSDWVPFETVVDVPVMFQPAPLPRSSSGVRTTLPVVVWSAPLSVSAVNVAEAGATSERPPAEHGGLKVAMTAPQVVCGLAAAVSVSVEPLDGLSL